MLSDPVNRLCPLLNGEKKQDETLNDAVFTMGSP